MKKVEVLGFVRSFQGNTGVGYHEFKHVTGTKKNNKFHNVIEVKCPKCVRWTEVHWSLPVMCMRLLCVESRWSLRTQLYTCSFHWIFTFIPASYLRNCRQPEWPSRLTNAHWHGHWADWSVNVCCSVSWCWSSCPWWPAGGRLRLSVMEWCSEPCGWCSPSLLLDLPPWDWNPDTVHNKWH